MLVTACTSEKGDPVTDTPPATSTPSKSMEQALADMQRMRSEMTAALEKKYGPPRWRLATNDQPLIQRSGCSGISDSRDGEVARLPVWATAEAYPEGEWHEAARIVEKVGRRYGFDRVETVVDRASDFEVDGRAPDGGQYTFGFAAAGALQINTGCYVWNDKPQGLVRDTES